MDDSAVISKTDILTITTSTSQIIVSSSHYTVIAKALHCEEYLVNNLLKWPWSLTLFQCVLLKKVSGEIFHDAAFYGDIVDDCLQVRISKDPMLVRDSML